MRRRSMERGFRPRERKEEGADRAMERRREGRDQRPKRQADAAERDRALEQRRKPTREVRRIELQGQHTEQKKAEDINRTPGGS